MKKTTAIGLLLLFCMNVTLFAQKNEEQRKIAFEKFKSERKAYITKEMDLTDDEAKKFWPLCDELMEKKFELNKPLRELWRKMREARKGGRTVSEADYKKAIELGASIKVKEAQLEEEYLKKFVEVIPAKKVHKYQYAEQEFGRKAMAERQKKGYARPHD